MKAAIKTLLFLAALAFASQAGAQVPKIAGIASELEESVGYSYMQANVPSQGQLPMMGTVLSATKSVNLHLALKLQAGYSRSSDAFQTGRKADVLTYMIGPVIYPIRRYKYDIHTHILFGGARETGVAFENGGTLVRGFVNEPAWAAGAGFQYRITRSLSLRPEVEYLKTSYFDPTVAVHSQSNLRMSVSLAFRLGQRE
jgi:hypothetical protein